MININEKISTCYINDYDPFLAEPSDAGTPVNDPIVAFVASEDDDEDGGADAEVKNDNKEDEDAKTFELVPNRDILIHKPQVGAIYSRLGLPFIRCSRCRLVGPFCKGNYQ